MSKICTSCGAMNLDNATNCSRCRKPLPANRKNQRVGNNVNWTKGQNRQTSSMMQQISTVQNPQQSARNMNYYQQQAYDSGTNQSNQFSQLKLNQKNTQKLVLCIVTILLIFIGLTFFAISKQKPSENWLKKNLPQDLLQFTMQDEDYVSTVSNLEMTSCYKQMDLYYVDFKVTLESDSITREMVCQCSIAKQSWFDFVLLDCAVVADQNQYMLNLEKAKEYADVYMKKIGYLENEISLENYFTADSYGFDDLECEYRVDSKSTYFNANGTAVYSGTLYTEGADNCLPQDFYLRESLDVSGVDCKWDLEGTWEGYSDDYHFVMEITETGDNTFSWSGKCFYENIYGDEDYYEGDGTLKYSSPLTGYSELGYSEVYAPSDAVSSYSFWCGYPWCFVEFYPDYALFHIGKNTEDSAFEKR